MKAKKYQLFIVIIGAFLLSSGVGLSQDFKNVGHSGANFLQIPVDAAGAALGNSYVALARGVEGLYWNPAAVSFTRGTEVLLSTADWILDTQLSHLGVSRNLGRWGSIGIGITAFTMDDMEVTTELQSDGTGEFFSAGNFAAGFIYALPLTDRFSFGMGVKYVHEYIWNTSTSVMAFDFGSVYRTEFYNLRIGMNIANFGGNMQLSGTAIDQKLNDEQALGEPNNPRLERLSSTYSLPQVFNVGIAFDPYRTSEHRITVSSTANDPTDNQTRLSFGGEYAFREMFMLRAGYKNGYDQQRFSMGIGVRFNYAQVESQLDYGFTEFGLLGNMHFFSFRVGF